MSTRTPRTAPRSPSAPRRSLLALATLASFSLGSAAFAGVDLASLVMVGPGQAHVGSSVIVNINVADFGSDPAGDYTAEVVISTDNVVDPLDTVVATVTNSIIGYQTLTATIPPSMTGGKYHWGFRVLPSAGEVVLANNAAIGTQVNILATDLELDDPTPISFFWTPTSTSVPSAEVLVSNIGTHGSIAVFAVETMSPAPWLEIDTPSNFAIAGEEGNAVTLTPVVEGLPLGTYNATVRFQNIYKVDDFALLDVTLTVGPIVFNPGDRVVGNISIAGDEDRLEVDVIKGERIIFRGRSNSGDLKIRVSAFDPNGDFESSITFKHSHVFTNKKIKFKQSGSYTLLIDGAKDTIGAYQIKTDRKLPKKARPRMIKLANPAGDVPARIEILALPGATVDIGVSTIKGFDNGVTIACIGPSSQSIDLTPHTTNVTQNGLQIEDLTIDEVGLHVIEIGGFLGDSMAKVSVYPLQPVRGKAKIYLP